MGGPLWQPKVSSQHICRSIGLLRNVNEEKGCVTNRQAEKSYWYSGCFWGGGSLLFSSGCHAVQLNMNSRKQKMTQRNQNYLYDLTGLNKNWWMSVKMLKKSAFDEKGVLPNLHCTAYLTWWKHHVSLMDRLTVYMHCEFDTHVLLAYMFLCHFTCSGGEWSHVPHLRHRPLNLPRATSLETLYLTGEGRQTRMPKRTCWGPLWIYSYTYHRDTRLL